MHPLRERTIAGRADAVLQRTLPVATRRAVDKQSAAWADLPDVETLRARAAAVKEHTLQHLDVYLERFAAAAEGNGVHVHWAATQADALRIIDEVVDRHNVRTVVKAKSMATEELDLREHLVARGLSTWETDLGEYIVQLSGKKPSHVTAPAIHEDTASISKLFHEHLGTPLTDSAELLAGAAREVLRPQFERADLGVSGANFVCADTGRLVLVENESNIRWCVTTPKVHVAVVGLEKVIPRQADADVLLKLLARSATGQKLTTYTHWLRGPRRAGETEGPEEMHVVLLDNGRSRMLGDAVGHEALRCIRCGACQNVCPVYQAVGGHAYGGVYGGPIGAITAPWLSPGADSRRLPYASTLCGACADVCPVKIPIPEILLRLRAKAVEEGHRPGDWLRGFFVEGYVQSVAGRKRFDLARRVGHGLVRPGGDLPPPLSGWTDHREFPRPAKEGFHALWRRHKEGQR